MRNIEAEKHAEDLYKQWCNLIRGGVDPGRNYSSTLMDGFSERVKAKLEAIGCKFTRNEHQGNVWYRVVLWIPRSPGHEAVGEQWVKMRLLKSCTVEDDVKHNSNYELNDMAYHITFHNSQLSDEDWLEYAKERAPHWNQEWLAKTRHKTYKDRLKVGISLLIAELERVMYLENQRISNNDSSTASNSGDPESNG